MILGLLNHWMSSKAAPMDMDPPLPCPMTPTMIYSSMPVLGMTKLKRAIYFQVLGAQEGHLGVFPQFQYCGPSSDGIY